MQSNPRLSANITSNISKNASKFTSKTNQIRLGGAIGASPLLPAAPNLYHPATAQGGGVRSTLLGNRSSAFLETIETIMRLLLGMLLELLGILGILPDLLGFTR